MTEDGAWFLWGVGVLLLSCAWGAMGERENLNHWRKQNNLPYDKDSRWLKTIIAVWCAWVLPPFIAAWVRLVLS
jgi:hypothetical protein